MFQLCATSYVRIYEGAVQVGTSIVHTQDNLRFAEVVERVNCPNCGGLLPRRFRYTKLMVCDSCGSILYLRRDAIEKLGTQAVLADHPSLFQLYHRFAYGKWFLEPVGMLQYSYGRGFWEEWWCLDNDGKGYWISVDEGDFVMEQKHTPRSP